MNLGKVLEYTVIVTGEKSPGVEGVDGRNHFLAEVELALGGRHGG